MRQILYAVCHPFGHLALLRTTARAKNLGVATGGRPTAWKYVGLYLDARIDPKARRNLIAYHYNWMMGLLPRSTALHDVQAGIPIWKSVDKAGIEYSVVLKPATICPMEGELEFVFHDSEGRLAFLTFLVVPGARFGADEGPAMLIGGIQGGYGRREDYRRASKGNGEVTPMNILVIAIRAFADATRVKALVAVPHEGLVARLYADHLIYLNYNSTWTDMGGELNDAGYFTLDIHKKANRSLDHLSSPHRARARRKTAFKANLQEQFYNRFVELLQPAGLIVAEAAGEVGDVVPASAAERVEP